MAELPIIGNVTDSLSSVAQQGADKARYIAVQALRRMPASVKVRLAGSEPPTVDGDTLDLDLHVALAAQERIGNERSHDVEVRRANTRRDAAMAAGRPVEVGAVRELLIPGADGKLRARHYIPADDSPGARPLIVFLHGGGFVAGDVDTHDLPCRLLCRYADAHVLSVEYRLAPEYPFPHGVEDAIAAFDWAMANAQQLGADPDRVAIGGDSAGGALSAVVCLHRRDAGLPQPAAQLLIYPATDSTKVYPSEELFAEGYFLTRADMDFFMDHYSSPEQRHDHRVSPLRAEHHGGLAPALVYTAAFDPLRDEGEAYAEALRDSGTPVRVKRVPGLVHGFVNMAGINTASRTETIAMARALRSALDHGLDDDFAARSRDRDLIVPDAAE